VDLTPLSSAKRLTENSKNGWFFSVETPDAEKMKYLARCMITGSSISPTRITEVSYGQDVHRRVGAAIGIGVVTFGLGALMPLAKSKKHFIGLTWDDAGNKGGFAFQADKHEYRGIMAGLEVSTARRP